MRSTPQRDACPGGGVPAPSLVGAVGRRATVGGNATGRPPGQARAVRCRLRVPQDLSPVGHGGDAPGQTP
jgi:hypothetical protein